MNPFLAFRSLTTDIDQSRKNDRATESVKGKEKKKMCCTRIVCLCVCLFSYLNLRSSTSNSVSMIPVVLARERKMSCSLGT
jgi:hypothetical protein